VSRRRVLAALLLLAAAPELRAEPGRTAATTLQMTMSARALGMGEAFCAVMGGLDSLNYNPAGITVIPRPELSTSYASGIAGDGYGALGYAHPLSAATLAGELLYYSAGDVNLSYSDGTQRKVTAQRDMLGMVSVGVPLGWGLSAGGTGKFFRLELAEEARTTGYAADLGALWQTPLKGLDVGASVRNMGPDVKFEQDGDPLPLALRLGAAYSFDLARRGFFKEGGYGISRLLVAADGVKVRDEDGWKPTAGLEIGMGLGEQTFGALRFGYMFSLDTGYLTFGVGLRQGRWVFDYALAAMRGDVSNTHHFTLGVKF